MSQTLRAFISKPDAGKVTPFIDRTFQLGDAAAAIGYIGERRTQGKTVVTV